jgi:hypothetical protein
MKKTLVALLVVTAFVPAAPADAHTLSITTARAMTVDVAHQEFLLAGSADAWGGGRVPSCKQSRR